MSDVLVLVILSILSAAVIVISTMNFAAVVQQVKSGEEEFEGKVPTLLILAGITVSSLSVLSSIIFSDSNSAAKALEISALLLFLAGVYLGFQKHAKKYIGESGRPRKVSFAGVLRPLKKEKKLT